MRTLLARAAIIIFAVCTIGLLALVIAGGAPKAALDSKASLVTLWVQSAEGWVFTCSAGVVQIGRAKRIVSAAHCIEEPRARRYRIRTQDGKLHPVLEIIALNGTEPQDSVVLRSTAVHTLPALKMAETPLTEGDAVYVWHDALGFQPLFSSGTFMGVLKTLDGDTDFQPVWDMAKTSLEVGPGASGSIVVNEAGEAVGVVSRRLGANWGMNGSILSPLPR